MNLAGLAVAIVTLLLAGFGVTLLLARGPRPRNALECLCFAWVLGAGAISLLLWCVGFFLSGVGLRIAVTAGALIIGFSGWKSGRARGMKFYFPRPADAVEWLLAGVVALEISAMVLVSLGRPLGWDGSFNWEIKARFAFLNDGIMPAAYYSSSSQINSHPEYPLFIPLTQLWLDLWMGEANQFWEKVVFPIFNAGGVILLALLGARISGRRWAGGVIAALLFFVPYLARGAGGVTSGYVDFPLGVLYLAAIGYLLLYEATGDETSFRLYAASLALLPWLKREGAILWLIAAVCGMGVIYRRKSNPRLCFGLLPGLLIFVVWQLNLKMLGTAPPHDFVHASLATLTANLHRLGPICASVFAELGLTERWSIFWLLAAVAFFHRLARTRELRFIVLWIAILAPIVLGSGSYVFSAWPDYLLHINRSLPRLLLQVTPVAWLTVALALASPLRGDRSQEPIPRRFA